ncbi:MAG: glycosyltransferase [Cyclobacteriaceae bacterium]|nr:glycosyltransferase [Cyclobacteriaceae bacterium]
MEKDFVSSEMKNKIINDLANKGIAWLPFNYHRFGIRAILNWLTIFFKLIRLIIQHGISTIHCWATPAGAIGYWLSLVLKKELIIDSYEPHAESMIENGTWKRGGVAYKTLFWLERKQTQRAKHIIATTQGMKDYALKKYNIEILNFHVKPACVDFDLFSESKIKDTQLLAELNLNSKIVCVYAGKFGGIYLESEVFDFFRVAVDYWGDLFRVLILTSHTREQIEGYCDLAGISPAIVISTYVSHSEIPKFIGLGDFAITPVKPLPSKRFCSPIKDGEYWAMGLPIVIPENISDDSRIIRDYGIGSVLEKLDNDSYLKSVREIDGFLQKPRNETQKLIRLVASKYRNFALAEDVYKKIYAERS